MRHLILKQITGSPAALRALPQRLRELLGFSGEKL